MRTGCEMRFQDTRHSGRLGLLAGCALAVALAAAAVVAQHAAAADPPRLIRSHTVLSVACVPGPNNTVRARVRVRMRVVNYSGIGDWADHMQAKARLEPTTTGLNYTRRWASWKTPYLTQDRKHTYVMNLTTDNVSGTASWRVHLKLTWHRPAPIRNISKDVYKSFRASCADVTGGFLPGPAPALPSPGAG